MSQFLNKKKFNFGFKSLFLLLAKSWLCAWRQLQFLAQQNEKDCKCFLILALVKIKTENSRKQSMQRNYDSINFIHIIKTVVDLTGIKFDPQIL